MLKISIIVPIYNEAVNAGRVLESLLDLRSDWKKEVIVVDDGSTDGSSRILGKWERRRLAGWKWRKHQKNMGKGAAVRTGLSAATGDYMVIFDADGECDARDLKLLVDRARRDNLPAVIGTRNKGNLGNRAIYWHLYMGVRFLAYLINVLYEQNISDPEMGMKLVHRRVIDFEIVENGFGQEIEWVVKLARKGIKLVEVPVRYYPRSYAQGKKITWKDGLRALYLVFKFDLLQK